MNLTLTLTYIYNFNSRDVFMTNKNQHTKTDIFNLRDANHSQEI